jgi:hypothetical protein
MQRESDRHIHIYTHKHNQPTRQGKWEREQIDYIDIDETGVPRRQHIVWRTYIPKIESHKVTNVPTKERIEWKRTRR